MVNITQNNKIYFIDANAGFDHIIGLDSKNRVYGWGNNQYGKLFMDTFKSNLKFPT